MSTELQTRKTLYTAKVHTAGDRDGGRSRSDDGQLDVAHTIPGKGKGTNPEQLLAAGWSACFQGAMGLAAARMKVSLPAGTAIDAQVDLRLGDDGYSLAARLLVSLPGIAKPVAQARVELAHQTCPYSKALNIPVDITLD